MTTPPDSPVTEMECPCCGTIAAEANERGLFYDGQPVTCGCATCVSGDVDGMDIEMPEDECPPNARCHDPDDATPPNNTPGADSVDVEAVAREFAADWGMTHETAHDLADVLQAHGDAMYERGKREERERLLTEFDATGVCDDWVLDALRTKEGGKP